MKKKFYITEKLFFLLAIIALVLIGYTFSFHKTLQKLSEMNNITIKTTKDNAMLSESLISLYDMHVIVSQGIIAQEKEIHLQFDPTKGSFSNWLYKKINDENLSKEKQQILVNIEPIHRKYHHAAYKINQCIEKRNFKEASRIYIQEFTPLIEKANDELSGLSGLVEIETNALIEQNKHEISRIIARWTIGSLLAALAIIALSASILYSNRVSEKERSEMQMNLVEISREAGMSEVATGVLHNVGNVLNSINISANLLDETMRNSRIQGLYRLSEIVASNQNNFSEFTSTLKGQQIPSYIIKLTDAIKDERLFFEKELTNLNNNIENVKNIINLQQSLAMKSGIIEEITVTDIIDNALQINNSVFARRDIKISKQNVEHVVVTADRLKMLQILVNLISNAAKALSSAVNVHDKIITIFAIKTQDNMVQIDIVDNGIGIAKENLPHIFQYGFTTRKTGHGFGLHNSALAAKELGGTLTVYSDGLDKGARFTLTIPITRRDLNV